MGRAQRAAWVARRVGDWRWQLHPEWTFLLGPEAPDWTTLPQDPQAGMIKSNDGRYVWRTQLGPHLLFVKVTRPARRWARCRRLIYGADSQREFRAAAYAEQYGIDTVRPVALAQAPIRGRAPASVLITVGLPCARPLSQVWSGLDPGCPSTRAVKNGIIDAVARLIAHAHQCGFEHFDLHAGNVLLDRQPDGCYRPLFVDLHNVRIGRAVRQGAVTRNLAQFNQWFRLHAPLTDRIRFLNRYLLWRQADASASRYARRLNCERHELLASLEDAAAAHARFLYAKRDARILRSGRYFARLELPGAWRAHVFLESKHPVPGSRTAGMAFTAGEWRNWLGDPLALVRCPDRRWLIKDSASAVVCRNQLPHAGEPIAVVCKRATSKNLLKRAASLLRPSRAMLTWRRGNALLHRQVITARPLAVLEQRRGGLLRDSLLITEYVQHACDLDTLLTVQVRELDLARQRRLKRQLGAALARLVRILENRGVAHRDFKAPNLIVQWDPAAEQPPRIVLVDLDGITLGRRVRGGAVRRMLVRLNISLDHCRRVTLADRARFLREYLARLGRPDPDWKPLWRRVAAASERMRRARDRDQQRKFRKYGRF